MGTTTMIGRLGTAVPVAACAPTGIRLRSAMAHAFVAGAGWQRVPARATVLPNVTDNCTGVSVSGRRHRH